MRRWKGQKWVLVQIKHREERREENEVVLNYLKSANFSSTPYTLREIYKGQLNCDPTHLLGCRRKMEHMEEAHSVMENVKTPSRRHPG